MKACFNCHKRAKQLNEKNFCEDCHDGMTPEQPFTPVYDFDKGNDNKSRTVKP